MSEGLEKHQILEHLVKFYYCKWNTFLLQVKNAHTIRPRDWDCIKNRSIWENSTIVSNPIAMWNAAMTKKIIAIV